jgi:HK97 family phage major capsid protein
MPDTYPDFQNQVDEDLGGELTSQEIADEVFLLVHDASAIDALSRPVPMKKKYKKFRGVTSGIGGYWVENPGEAKKTGTFGKLILTAEEMAVINLLDQDDLDDMDVDMAALIADDTIQSFAETFDGWCISDAEAPSSYDQLSSGIAVDHQVAFGSRDDVVGDISLAMSKIEMDLKRDITGFIGNPMMKDLLRDLRDANGHPIYHDNLQAGVNADTLYGRPVKFTGKVEGESSPVGFSLYVGNWNYALVGNRKAVTIDISTDATVVVDGETYNLFQMDMEAHRYTMRKAFKVRDWDAFSVVTGITQISGT